MADLRELYQELILDHSKKPRNYREMPNANRRVEGFNPLCGDHFTVYMDMEGETVKDVSFQGSGCALSKASASMMTQALKGKTKTDAEALFERFHDLVTGKAGEAQAESLGKLAVFSGVSDFPVRVKCASLAWHAMKAAIEGDAEQVSTE
ncbi:MAG TPA: SUF system NifU family Fe-S cluster assembly protein [Terriglobales bacterium]|nr:SUF system NifU family Fe-S cluster assembly protein [Terriglobales bacterium]